MYNLLQKIACSVELGILLKYKSNNSDDCASDFMLGICNSFSWDYGLFAVHIKIEPQTPRERAIFTTFVWDLTNNLP